MKLGSFAYLLFPELKSRQQDFARLQAVFESLFDAVYTVDSEKRITSCNSGMEAVTGYKKEDVIGKTCHDFIEFQGEFPDFLCGTEYLLEEVMKSGHALAPRKIFIKNISGARLASVAGIAPIKDEKGLVTGAAVFFREVTNELKIEQLKSDFLSVVSHELRIPLATMKESINLLTDGIAGAVNDKQKGILSTVSSHIERLGGLVSSLLDVSSIESGRFRVHRSKLELKGLAGGIQQFFQPTADKKGVRLSLNIADDLPAVIGDSDRVTQVFSNLLNNAFKFTASGGSVTISCFPYCDSFVACSVSDTGSGIAPEQLNKLFVKFEQLGVEESKRRGGAGLGLSISKKIVEDLGGSIWAESRVGEGSSFTFTLPIYSEDAELQLELNGNIQTARYEQSSLALLKLEVGLKEEGFQKVFQAVKSIVRRPGDLVIQHAEDIFIILPNTNRQGALSVIERIRAGLLKADLAGPGAIKRFGIAIYPDDAAKEKELIARSSENIQPF